MLLLFVGFRDPQARLDIPVSRVQMEPQDLGVREVKMVNLEKVGKGLDFLTISVHKCINVFLQRAIS